MMISLKSVVLSKTFFSAIISKVKRMLHLLGHKKATSVTF